MAASARIVRTTLLLVLAATAAVAQVTRVNITLPGGANRLSGIATIGDKVFFAGGTRYATPLARPCVSCVWSLASRCFLTPARLFTLHGDYLTLLYNTVLFFYLYASLRDSAAFAFLHHQRFSSFVSMLAPRPCDSPLTTRLLS